ncbi:MAG: serine hydrolase domain-containing protein, partial [Rhodospirillaceae bacterium]|nr:serine hydrolase domain-containing protein [Rhodospirillaceae bacterium]
FKSLDDPIGAYIEEWAGDDRGKITLRQLLSMSSGLTTTASSGGLFSETMRFQMGLFPERLLLGRQVARPPNTDFEYLNVNSNLVGLALQRSLGRRYAEYLSEKIWRPIGASDGYVVPARPGGFVKTSGTLLAQARDWLRVGLLLKDDGLFNGRRVLPEGWVAQMTASSATNPIYGMQVWRASPHVAERYYNNARQGFMVPAAEPFLAEDMVYLDGFGGQRVYVSPAEDLVIVRTGPFSPKWDDAALPNLVVKELRAP